MKRKKNNPPPSGRASWDADLQPAPGDLGLAQALTNTFEVPSKTDRLTTPEAVATWLEDHGLGTAGMRVSKTDHARLLQVRRGVRALAFVNHGKEAKEATFEELDRAASDAKLVIRFTSSGTGRVEPADDGVDGAIARLLHAVIVAQQEGRLRRLKICLEPECGRVYYDFSPGRTSRWCSERCGNRRSAQRYRRRHKNELIY